MKLLSIIAPLIMSVTLGNACGEKLPTGASKDCYIVKMETSKGTMTLELSNLTPQHRDNFVKLCDSNYYDGLAFHRVIENFMIQGGDPETRNMEAGKQYGSGGPDYTIPAEINAQLIHVKGALAAARQGDAVNPERRSSGSQFYIVHGRPMDTVAISQLDQQLIHIRKMEAANAAVQAYVEKNRDSLTQLTPEAAQAKVNEIGNVTYQSTQASGLTADQKAAYQEKGGAPHLDGQYTVFGMLLEGFEVLDAIAAVEKDGNDCPKEKVTIISCKVIHRPGGKK